MMALLDCICCCRHHLRTAVCWDNPEEPSPRFLTYSCIVERANEISRALTLHLYSFTPQSSDPAAVSADHEQQLTPVGIYGRGCPEVLCALLGVMAASAPYMPLDLGQPAVDRWSIMQERCVSVVLIELSLFDDFLSECCLPPSNYHVSFDSQLFHLGLVLCHIRWFCDLLEIVNEVSVKPYHISEEFHTKALEQYYMEVNTDCWVCALDSSSTEEKHRNLDFTDSLSNSHLNCFPSLHPASLAYILHTTGTTGHPKPVWVPHCCVVPNIIDLRGKFAMSPYDVVFNAAPLTFDPSVVEIFLSLSSGACLLMVPTKVKRSPHCLSKVLFLRQHTTVLQVTPALMRQLSDSVITSGLLGRDSHVRVLAFGGETCPSLEALTKWKSPQNKTAIFNIYGITEVSSWATCYQVTDADANLVGPGNHPSSTVPLGSPLLGTQIELRDEDGLSVKHGSGFVWIGGFYRVCLLGDEHRLLPGVLRSSGDLGHFDENGRLVYEGRCDRQIKRRGHRVNLDCIQQKIEGLEPVASCAVLGLSQLNRPLGPELKLVAFIVIAGTLRRSKTETESFLFAKMMEVLPNYCIPDHIELLERVPVNEHGKVDTRALQQFYSSVVQTITSTTTKADRTSLTLDSAGALLKSCARRVLGLRMWSDRQSILELGASSFDVVRLANHLEEELKQLMNRSSGNRTVDTSELVECLLEQPLAQIAAYLCSAFSGEIRVVSNVYAGGDADVKREGRAIAFAKKRIIGVDDELLPEKKLKKMESKELRSFRRGQRFVDGRLQYKICHHSDSLAPLDQMQQKFSFELNQKWKVNTGKCVDASPLLVVDESRDPSEMIYIGSHSGRFFAICFQSSRVLWQSQLADRIESSACLSRCGEFVIVGCYDGSVYTLTCDSGTVHWHIQPGGSSEPVKSSPCVDPVTGLVWIGSHDHHIYALDIHAKEVVYRVFPGGGSCFASPCVDDDKRQLYCATLQGFIVAVNLDSGVILWRYKCLRPFFSSPALLPGGDSIAVGCVDGGVYVITSSGQHVVTLSTTGAVFSSCSVIQEDSSGQTRIYCGSHDRHMYCWNGEFKLEWKSQELDSEIYSIPYVSPIQYRFSQETYWKCVLFTSTTSGHIYALDSDSGLVTGSLALPSNLFSSPVVYNNCLTVGCRDDYVYSYRITLTL